MGRVDLELFINDESYYVEFKQFYPHLSNGIGVGAENRTHNNYKNAKKDLAKAKIKDVKGLIGLFAIPYMNSDKNENPTKHIRDYLNWLADEKTPDVLAWWFPKKISDLSNPGIILFLRRAKK